MFGSRRHRPPPKQPLTAATAHPNAAMAAAAVFKSREQQQPSLAAAAAGAALRARPMTPTNVGEVQTKRTMRRTGSVSSSGTAPDYTQARPGLQRRSSSASMTERTFRSPSPGGRRASSTASNERVSTGSREPAPPVPALPKNVDNMGTSHRRKPQSLQLSSPPLRLASQTLGKDGGGSWFGAAQVGDLGSVRTSDAAMASPPLSPPPRISHPDEEERPDSRNSSHNFSYPSRVRVGSPPVSPTVGRFDMPQVSNRATKRASSASSSIRARPASTGAVQSMVYDPNSRRMVPREDPNPPNYESQSFGRAPSLRKKKKQPAKTGTHLEQATMGRTQVAPATAAYQNVEEPQSVRFARQGAREDEPQRREQPVLTTSYHVIDDEPDEPADAATKTDEPTTTSRVPIATYAAQNLQEPTQEQQHNVTKEEPVKSLIEAPRSEATNAEQQRPRELLPPTTQSATANTTGPEEFTWTGHGVRRQPSTVKEEPEPEDDQPQSPGGITVAHALDSVPTRQTVYLPPAQQAAPTENARPRAASAVHPKPTSLQVRKTSNSQRDRSLSSSPARTARFGTVQEGLTVRHCPPPRSVSPRKSALKNSASPDRHGSVDDNASEASSSFNHREDSTVARKKSFRVSFDDSNTVVVGESPGPDMGNSPIVASPQNSGRRPWYGNVGRAKKAELPNLSDDEIMKPRPVLPSFGSVRDKKPKENVAGHEERPLVRPVMDQGNGPPVHSTSMAGSSTTLPAIPAVSDELRADTNLNAMTTGSDSTGLSQAESDGSAKVAANTSRFREPLPPVVTSIEGSGYLSDTSSEDDQAHVASAEDAGHKVDKPQAQQQTTTPAFLDPRTTQPRPVSSASSEGDFQDASTGIEDKGKGVERNIPSISVSLPTPDPAKMAAHRAYFGFPGAFPTDDSEVSTPDAESSPSYSMTEIETTPVRQVAFEPVSQSEDGTPTPQTPATVTATFAPIIDMDDEDANSVYSDAPDHFTDTENEGFLSLDAVVESTSLPAWAKETENELGLVQGPKRVGISETPQLGTELSTATTAVDTTQQGEPVALDWDRAKAYWRSLTADKRSQLEKEALSDAGVDADVEEDQDVSQKPKKKKSIERRNSERKALAVRMAQQTIAAQQQKQAEEDRAAAAHRAAERTYMIKPGTKVGADHSVQRHPVEERKSGAKSPDSALKLRTSMRNGAAPKPSQPEQPRAHALGGKTMRPMSVGSAVSAPKTMGRQTMRSSSQGVSAPPAAGAGAAARSSFNPPPPNRRRGSDSSETSFRRTSRPESGSFGFRKTLRGASPAQSARNERVPVPKGPSGRFSLRSMSPPSPSNRAAAPGGMGMNMRQSLRGSAPQPKTSTGGKHFPGFGKSSTKSPAKFKAGSSRFGDSSDEDAGPSTFRSRFEESSDEDDVRTPSVSMSMPKTMRSGRQVSAINTNPTGRYQPAERSPALAEEEEESDSPIHRDEEKEVLTPLPKRTNSRSGRGDIVNSPPATPLEKPKASRRGSFMSVLRRKKNKGGIARPEVMDSAARRDTKLERTPDELKEIRRSGDLDRDEEVDSPVRPRSPRLQKRTNSMPLDAVLGGSAWPLGSPGGESGTGTLGGGAGRENGGAAKRPSTSGNLGTRTMGSNGAAGRPAFMQRRTASANLLGAVGEGSVVGEGGKAAGKKKKFGGLRRMFGLDD